MKSWLIAVLLIANLSCSSMHSNNKEENKNSYTKIDLYEKKIKSAIGLGNEYFDANKFETALRNYKEASAFVDSLMKYDLERKKEHIEVKKSLIKNIKECEVKLNNQQAFF